MQRQQLGGPACTQRGMTPPLRVGRLGLALTCPSPFGAKPPRVVASAVKEERKTTSGRKGDDQPRRTTSGRSTPPGSPPGTSSSRASTTTSNRRTPSPSPPPRQAPARPPPSALNGKGKGGSQLDGLMRRHPLLSRFYDTTLLLGDCVMIAATQTSSERIPWSDIPALLGVLLVCWVAAGAWNGDYSPSGTRAHDDVPWQLSMLGPTFGSVLGAALTWAFAATGSVAAYAVLVARNAMDAAPVVEGLNSDDLSPQLEVVVALLITMTCWRGIASRLRPSPSDD